MNERRKKPIRFVGLFHSPQMEGRKFPVFYNHFKKYIRGRNFIKAIFYLEVKKRCRKSQLKKKKKNIWYFDNEMQIRKAD